MANFKKHRVNPYLFILLKRMLEYEICGISERPTKLQLAQFIYARSKKKELRNTDYNTIKELRDTEAFRKAEGIRKDIFTPKDFDFSQEKLDQLAAEISVIDNFASWDDYLSRYQDDKGARLAEQYYKACPFSELTSDIQQTISAWAEDRLLKLHFEYIRNDKANNHRIIRSNEEFVIRTINANEIQEILRVSDYKPSLHDNEYERRKCLLKKNPNVYYIYRDDYDLWGYISLLPIKEVSFFQHKKKNQITADDIYSLEEKEQVKYIYVEDYFFKFQSIDRLFLKHFELLIGNIAGIDTHLIIGGEFRQNQKVQNLLFQFKFLTDTWDDEEGFIKIKWHTLRERINALVWPPWEREV